MNMSNPAYGDPRDAIGRSETRHAVIAAERAEQLAATLDLPGVPGQGELPPGWHWLYFNPFVRQSETGPDGHPRRGGFLPETGLPRRMWAGGRVTYLSPLPVGTDAEKTSEIIDVNDKTGKAGRLVFLTVRHQISAEGRLCIEEEQDIVYRADALPGAPTPAPVPAPEGAERSEVITPDPLLLFRYSALTLNGHRIHYDAPYARQEEHYPDLVVHGPLTATLLQGLALRCRPGARLSRFTFRGTAPLFVTAPFGLHAKRTDAGLDLWATRPDGGLAMQATATFEG